MTDEPLGQLIASAQSALADLPTLPDDSRAKRRLVDSAQVQADCAQAIATDRLASAVGRLADAITAEE